MVCSLFYILWWRFKLGEDRNELNEFSIFPTEEKTLKEFRALLTKSLKAALKSTNSKSTKAILKDFKIHPSLCRI